MTDPTPDSIAAALAHRDAERRQIEAITGVRILEDGSIFLPAQTYVMPCPRCPYVASAQSEGLAVRALAGHLVHEHIRDGGME